MPKVIPVADELSKKGHKVTIFDKKKSPWLRKNQKIIIGNILDFKKLETAISGSDIVYNFAALADIEDALKNPIESVKTNIQGTVHALELCKIYKIKRFVFASSIYVYSRDGGFYRCSKQAAETFVEEYYQLYGLKYTILRYGSLYGPRSDESNGLYKKIKKALKKNVLSYTGDKESRREYIHVEDAARASIKILDKEFTNQNLILTGQQSFYVYDVMEMLAEIMGMSKKIKFVKSEKNKGHYIRTPYSYQSRLARKYIPETHIDLGQGLLQLIDEIKKK
mgnify:CR=1 FL=1